MAKCALDLQDLRSDSNLIMNASDKQSAPLALTRQRRYRGAALSTIHFPDLCPRLVLTPSLPLLSVCVDCGEPAAPARRRRLAAHIAYVYLSDGARALTLNGNCIPKCDLTIATYIYTNPS